MWCDRKRGIAHDHQCRAGLQLRTKPLGPPPRLDLQNAADNPSLTCRRELGSRSIFFLPLTVILQHDGKRGVRQRDQFGSPPKALRPEQRQRCRWGAKHPHAALGFRSPPLSILDYHRFAQLLDRSTPKQFTAPFQRALVAVPGDEPETSHGSLPGQRRAAAYCASSSVGTQSSWLEKIAGRHVPSPCGAAASGMPVGCREPMPPDCMHGYSQSSSGLQQGSLLQTAGRRTWRSVALRLEWLGWLSWAGLSS